MITRDALYDFVQGLIDTAASGDALFEAQVFRNLRTSIEEAEKVVRVETMVGEHCLTEEDIRKELNVEATIQCWVTPDVDASDGNEQLAMDTATDLSFEMSREIFRGIATDPQLNGGACDASFETFETGEANLGSMRRGVTYLDGFLNQAS